MRRRLALAVAALLAACGGDSLVARQPEDGFEVSYTAGTRDVAGNFMGGTEMRNFATHQGKLYAGIGYWVDRPGAEGPQSAQILVLDGPGAPWRLEHSFDRPLPEGWRPRNGIAALVVDLPRRDFAISALASVGFATDANGRRLATPVSVLLAASWDTTGTVEVFSRDDSSGAWTAMALGVDAPAWDFLPMVRSLAAHRDRVTGVDRVFAGTDPRGIFSGAYDPSQPGRIRWESVPELDVRAIDSTSFPGLKDRLRVSSFAECNGLLYAAVGQQVYERSDGAEPRWRLVYTNPFPGYSETGLRGLTAIRGAAGRSEILLVAEEGNGGRIIRIDPGDGYKEATDLDLRAFLSNAWGTQAGYVITAYNDMTKVADPRGGEAVLIGFETFIPRNTTWPAGHLIVDRLEGGGWYLVRHVDGRYDLHKIATLHPVTGQPLVATRAIALSPFPNDPALYFGGYDANKHGAHDTAWIMRAPVSAALRSPQ